MVSRWQLATTVLCLSCQGALFARDESPDASAAPDAAVLLDGGADASGDPEPDAAADAAADAAPDGPSGREVIECDPGDGFCVVADEPGAVIENLEITMPPRTDDQWLCIYDQCGDRAGGVGLGGGILVTANDVTVRNVRIVGGVTGIAARQVQRLRVTASELESQSAWGIYLLSVDDATIERNVVRDAIRSCTLPDGNVVPDGCESAAFMAIDVQASRFVENSCSHSGDCYYLNGENALASNDNRFELNECTGSPHNCFEITFSTGNFLAGNRTGPDPLHGECNYPFWIGCSTITFSNAEPNDWGCTISADDAYAQARGCTDDRGMPTEILYE